MRQVTKTTHRLDREDEGANWPVLLRVDAYWCDAVDVRSKDRRYDLRLEYSLEQSDDISSRNSSTLMKRTD